MIFTETKLKGAYIIEPEKKEDERGFFARSFDSGIFKNHGLNPDVLQCNISYSKKKGTIRGMHFQLPPYQEAKFLRCVRGKIYDVIIDLRSKSQTYMEWIGFELSADNYKMLYAPEGFAAGFQTLIDDVELVYQVSQVYMPEYERGVKWNDPMFKIEWPLEPTVITEKDRSHPPFQDGFYKM
ncbi:MAG: dTDP-4-dehydrorhamnose 3,5-epimerase [Thaumarchaeota archaeon]|nr:dTDP-4-dehydrorhamnose 3,5-epimerase [Nitrososphaerota archaeon]